jgi:hypothetical protein
MRLIFFIGLFSFSTLFAQSDLLKAPPAFAYKKSMAVFINLQQADYKITYDNDQKKAFFQAKLSFITEKEGFPLFDLVSSPLKSSLNGKAIEISEIKTPDAQTTLKVIEQQLAPGSHELMIEGEITELVTFSEGQVRSAFWTSDLQDRNFLEQYLPSNLEYDQVKMKLEVLFKGMSKNHVIYTNGEITKLNDNLFNIEFPSYFNASSIFFHAVPVGAMVEQRFSFKSIDGRELPAVAYLSASSSWGDPTSTLNTLQERTLKILAELESDYGPFPHSSITIYNAGTGGMEYCGATMTEMRALGHELIHSYFARGVMPAQGNAGWIDEAIASWRDNGYPTRNSLLGSSQMAAHSVYARDTDRKAYTFGANFMAYLDGKFKGLGGLKSVLREMSDKMMFEKISTPDFIKILNSHYQINTQADFDRYIYSNKEQDLKDEKINHPFHQKMTRKELLKFL